MASNQDTIRLMLALGLTSAIVGGGGWWVWQQTRGGDPPGRGAQPQAQTADKSLATVEVAQLVSWGERTFTDITTPEKLAGMNAIATGDYPAAVTKLQASLAREPNDPETLIYLNNAQIGTGASYAIAVAVPAATALNAAKELLRGVAQAQNAINQAGGINGTPLKVAIVDDGNRAATVPAIATFLSQQPEILGVVGHFSSDVSKAAAPIYEQAGLVMISPTSTAVDLTTLGTHIFRTVPTDATTAKMLARYQQAQLQKTKAAIFYTSTSTYSQSLLTEFREELVAAGGIILAEVDVSQTADLTADITTVQQQGAEVLVLLTNTATLPSAITVLNQNRGQLPILAGDSLYSIDTLQRAGTNAQKMVLAVPWHSQSQAQDPFVQTARQLWGGDVNWRTAMAYDATQVFVTALRQTPNRAGIQATLHQNFQATGAAQPVSFLPSGDRAQTSQLITVQPGSRSGTGFDFVPLQD